MTPMIRQCEAGAEQCGDAVRGVTCHGQAAAFLRTIDCECADDDMTANFYGSSDARDISRLFFRRGEKMERCTVVPDVMMARWLPCRHIGDDPMHGVASGTEPCTRGRERRVGQIKDGQICIVVREQGSKRLSRSQFFGRGGI